MFLVHRNESRENYCFTSILASLLFSIDKILNLDRNLFIKRYGFHIAHVNSLWQDLSNFTIILDLVTLTLKFDLLFKNFNLGTCNNFYTLRDFTGTFLVTRSFSHGTIIFMPLAWKVRRGHLVIGSSLRLFVCLSIILSRLQTKWNI